MPKTPNQSYIVQDTDILFTVENSEEYISDSSYEHAVNGVVRTYPLKLRDLPIDDQPREKLVNQGPEALSLQELIAVILNTGTKSEDVLSMSKRVVREYGHSALVSQKDPKIMSESLDIPIGKACQIIAASEVGRRLYKKNEFGLQVIRSANDLFEFLKDMHNLPKEQLRGVYLDTHNRVIHDEVISIGTINSNIVHPREVFRPALEYGAASIILAHNHPSGINIPSEADIEITKQLISAGKIIGIRVLDHIVIAKNGYQSIDVDYE